MEIDIKTVRNFAVLRELVDGRYLWLPKTGRNLACSEDWQIGYLLSDNTTIQGDLTLREVVELLDENDIGMVIPQI